MDLLEAGSAVSINKNHVIWDKYSYSIKQQRSTEHEVDTRYFFRTIDR